MKPKTEDTFYSHNSASLTEAERRIKVLEEENLKLKRDLADISSLYNVLMKDGENEKFDERRVNLLKSQLIQLERQVLTLTESLGSRAGMLLEVENGLHSIAEITRNHMSEERGAVTVPRESLRKIVETAESCKIKLSKNIENSNPEKYSRPLLMIGKFIKQSPTDSVSLFDICNGSAEHINLKHVAKLESKLAQVFRELTSLNHGLRMSNGDVSQFEETRISCQIERTCELLKQTSAELLELSLLVPSAPWPPIPNAILKDITTEDVMASLPNFPKSRAVEGQQKIDALIKAFNYIITIKSLELKSTSRELQYQTAVHKCQQDYIKSLLESTKIAYTEFENNTNDIVCKPLKEVMNKYRGLEQTASESDLRDFLSSFKRHAPDASTSVKRNKISRSEESLMLNAVEQLEKNQTEGVGVDALSNFGTQFFESMDRLHTECVKLREDAVSELEQVKRESEGYQCELKQLFPSKTQSNKTEEQRKEEYQEIVSGTEELTLNPTHDEDNGSSIQEGYYTPTTDSSPAVLDSGVASSARNRRRAAKAVAAESPTSSSFQLTPKNTTQDIHKSEPLTATSAADTPDDICTCEAESDRTWETSLRRYTPDLALQSEDEHVHLAKSRPPLGPIKDSKNLTGMDSPTNQGKKLLPSRLPKVQSKLVETPPARGASSKIPRTPNRSGKPRTVPKTATPQAKLSLKARGNRSHSLENSGHDLSLPSESPNSSPSMKRSSSLSQRPDWVT